MTRDEYERAAREFWKRHVAAPFPLVGGPVGDFPLYDSLHAGQLSRACDGELFAADEVIGPDDATLEFLAALRRKPAPTEDERAFVEYFEQMEEARALLVAGFTGS